MNARPFTPAPVSSEVFYEQLKDTVRRYVKFQHALAAAIDRSHALVELGTNSRKLLLEAFRAEQGSSQGMAENIIERTSHACTPLPVIAEAAREGGPADRQSLLARLANWSVALKVMDHNLSLASGTNPQKLDYRSLKEAKEKLASRAGEALSLPEALSCLRLEMIPDAENLYRQGRALYPAVALTLDKETQRAALTPENALPLPPLPLPESLYWRNRDAEASNRLASLAQTHYKCRPVSAAEWNEAREADRRNTRGIYGI